MTHVKDEASAENDPVSNLNNIWDTPRSQD